MYSAFHYFRELSLLEASDPDKILLGICADHRLGLFRVFTYLVYLLEVNLCFITIHSIF